MNQNIELKWERIGSYPIENRANFWKAIVLSVIKPHLINRRLAGAEQIAVFQSSLCGINKDLKFIKHIAHSICERSDENVDVNFVLNILNKIKSPDEFTEIQIQTLSECDFDKENRVLVILSKLLPKNLQSHKCTYELAILDTVNKQIAFLNLLQNQTTGFIKKFAIQLNDHANGVSDMNVIAPNEADENFTRQSNWILSIFMPKMLKWIVYMDNTYDEKSKSTFESLESLSLINLTEYNEMYNNLKVKYGEEMVKIWPEQTDPSKYVYEDVAIATYLILLWRKERGRRQNTDTLQSFVDLGCGNGLLVYILSSEGHRGYGIDVRKRGIWDLYPATTVLRTEAIVPSDRSLFCDVDWIIGNHSDELSPWIPVISARSSYNSKYFLLPCCPFEFSGKKFQRRCSAVSQYMDFLAYVQQISDICGFETQIDRLKIPSTKRICLIGSQRTYPSNEQSTKVNQIQEFINKNSGPEKIEMTINDSNNWNIEFQPRSNIEKVQNCTTVDKTIQNDIIDRVFSELMKKKRFLSDQTKPNWNVGGKISLADLAKLISSDKLKALKSECGGLQTLLKNHSQVFRVINGVVEIKVPMKWDDKKRTLEAKGIDIQLKHKSCWFHHNHPDGCPLLDDDCSFLH